MANKTNTFNSRFNLSALIEKQLRNIFPPEIKIFQHGIEILSNKDQNIMQAFNLDSSYDSLTALSLQYLPDYILHDSLNNKVYYLDIKHSVTSLNYPSRMAKIQSLHPELDVNKSNVGIIAREAMYAYRRFYPETIVLYFSNYNSKVAMAQFVNKIKLLYAYGWNEKKPLENFAIGTENYFPFSRNFNAKGSKTPHVNVYLDSFSEAANFFGNIGINMDIDNLKYLKKKVKSTNI